jgi:type II secretory pathway component PulC
VEEVVEEVEETKLPLILLATIAAIETDLSRAAIHDQRSRVDEVVRPGDTLESHPDVTVDRIERGRVVLLNRGRREELTLADEETVATTSPRTQAAQRPRAATRRPVAKKRSPAKTSSPAGKKTLKERRARSERISEGIAELRELMAAGRLSAQDFQREVEALGSD